MALTERGALPIWLTAQNGNFLRLVPEGTDGAEKRKTKNEKIVFEKKYSKVEGIINSVIVQNPPEANPEYGKSLLVYLRDISDPSKPETYAVRMPLSGAYALGFLGRLPNVNIKSILELNIFDKKREDEPTKFQRVLFCKQNGVSIPSIWSKENKGEGENELPELTCLKPANKNKKTLAIWDSSERQEFLEKYIERFRNILKASQQTIIANDISRNENEVAASLPANPNAIEETDDLPF